MKPRVYLDSDVIISALISQTGAAFLIIRSPQLIRYHSSSQVQEISQVIKRLHLNPQNFSLISQQNLKLIKLPLTTPLSQYAPYTTDVFDRPIVAGAHKAKARFLVTYNRKHYSAEALKRDLGITLLSPGQLLQNLRNLKLN